MATPVRSDSLLTREFVALNALLFLSFSNIALFFDFHQYLATQKIDPEWFGFLIGIFSLVVVILRPVVSLFLRPDNAKLWIVISSVMVIPTLLLYGWAQEVWSMALVRSLHGAAFVIMVTALMAGAVDCIPEKKSGQAFGIIGVITLLPYAAIPPLLAPLADWCGSFERVLDLAALAAVLALPLAYLIKDRDRAGSAASDQRMRWGPLIENLKDRRVVLLMILSLIVWTSFTQVFFFLKGYGQEMGVTNPGWFFTLCTFTEMGVRLVAGSLLDRMPKSHLLAGALVFLTPCYLVLAIGAPSGWFYAMGLFFGLGWGVAVPTVNALIFDVSAPQFRALNTNLYLEMLQLGFFAGPLVGGAILVVSSYTALYSVCAGLMLFSLALTPFLGEKGRTTRVSAAVWICLLLTTYVVDRCSCVIQGRRINHEAKRT